jgi:DNA end-binding protein Ku
MPTTKHSAKQATKRGTKRAASSPRSTAKRSGSSARSRTKDHNGARPSRRALWKGAITFGLITVPVGLYSAVEERDVHFHLLDSRDGSRIRYQRVNAKTGKEVDRSDIVKGYEVEKGRYVTFTEEELDRIPAVSFRTIDVVQFADADQIDPVYFQSAYYLAPEESGVKAYALLAQALAESGRVGLAKITLRDKERLAVLRARDGVIVLETMNWPDEIREPPFDMERKPPVSTKEVQMAQRLIDELTDDFDPGRFEDEYRQRLEQAIQSKVKGDEISVAAEEASPSEEVSDLMEALRASVEAVASRTKAGGAKKAG